ncbi:MAG: hypothetical protein BAJALOKI1v1_1180011 [Promethearchaeota archaeon]|nr:MAG: hypothetical protein BAJALOKI1v1_1180011 [Candidatus Lokiarchaeota archaeon]
MIKLNFLSDAKETSFLFLITAYTYRLKRSSYKIAVLNCEMLNILKYSKIYTILADK